MTTVEMAQYVGKKGFLPIGGLKVDIEILDVNEQWGRLRFLVRPLAGEGQVWTEGVRS